MHMGKPVLSLILQSKLPILKQLQLEEALLRADKRNWCLINQGSPPSIVMGISGKIDEMIALEHHQKNPIPIIRRFSGGGTVVVDEDTLFITMICNSKDVPIPAFPCQILAWNGKLYRKALQGVDYQINENDYSIGLKKFGGNAQYICKERWLHHSTLLWNYSPEKMNLLKIPTKMPNYREQRAHNDFLSPLSSHLKCKKEFLSIFQESLEDLFRVEAVDTELFEEFLSRPHRKATTLLTNNR